MGGIFLFLLTSLDWWGGLNESPPSEREGENYTCLFEGIVGMEISHESDHPNFPVFLIPPSAR